MSLISVIVPIYNVAPYLNKCIQSLVNQTHRDMEIILIDDGSTDESGEICDKWAMIDSRIVVLHLSNAGVSHARNKGLQCAKGDYIGFVDSDDWIDENMYATMLYNIESEQSDIHVGGYIVETPQGQQLELRRGKPQTFDREEALRQMIQVSSRKRPLFRGHLWDKLFSHRILKNLYLDEKLKLMEDTWFVWQAFRRAQRISYFPQFEYHYRMRENSVTHMVMKKRNGTYMDSMNLIRKDSLELDSKTIQIVQEAYDEETLNVLKDIVLAKSTDFTYVFLSGQKEIRNHIISLLVNDIFSLRQKLGFVCFCLPKCVLYALRPLLDIQKRRRELSRSKAAVKSASLDKGKK